MSSEKIIPNYEDAVIANGATDSNWVDLQGKQLVAIVFPATMTGGSVKFRGRVDSGSGNMITEKKTPGTDYPVPFVANKWTPIDVDVFCGAASLQVVSASAEGAARTIRLITRPVN
jgi:hypothetical protein